MRYFILEKVRLDSFGSPFRNVNSGVDEAEDQENIQRFNKGLQIYIDEFKSRLPSRRNQKHRR